MDRQFDQWTIALGLARTHPVKHTQATAYRFGVKDGHRIADILNRLKKADRQTFAAKLRSAFNAWSDQPRYFTGRPHTAQDYADFLQTKYRTFSRNLRYLYLHGVGAALRGIDNDDEEHISARPKREFVEPTNEEVKQKFIRRYNERVVKTLELYAAKYRSESGDYAYKTIQKEFQEIQQIITTGTHPIFSSYSEGTKAIVEDIARLGYHAWSASANVPDAWLNLRSVLPTMFENYNPAELHLVWDVNCPNYEQFIYDYASVFSPRILVVHLTPSAYRDDGSTVSPGFVRAVATLTLLFTKMKHVRVVSHLPHEVTMPSSLAALLRSCLIAPQIRNFSLAIANPRCAKFHHTDVYAALHILKYKEYVEVASDDEPIQNLSFTSDNAIDMSLGKIRMNTTLPYFSHLVDLQQQDLGFVLARNILKLPVPTYGPEGSPKNYMPLKHLTIKLAAATADKYLDDLCKSIHARCRQDGASENFLKTLTIIDHENRLLKPVSQDNVFQSYFDGNIRDYDPNYESSDDVSLTPLEENAISHSVETTSQPSTYLGRLIACFSRDCPRALYISGANLETLFPDSTSKNFTMEKDKHYQSVNREILSLLRQRPLLENIVYSDAETGYQPFNRWQIEASIRKEHNTTIVFTPEQQEVLAKAAWTLVPEDVRRTLQLSNLPRISVYRPEGGTAYIDVAEPSPQLQRYNAELIGKLYNLESVSVFVVSTKSVEDDVWEHNDHEFTLNSDTIDGIKQRLNEHASKDTSIDYTHLDKQETDINRKVRRLLRSQKAQSSVATSDDQQISCRVKAQRLDENELQRQFETLQKQRSLNDE